MLRKEKQKLGISSSDKERRASRGDGRVVTNE